MSSLPNLFSFKNLSLCIYVGNIASIEEKALLHYCAQFGTIASSFPIREKFCDFNIIEYSTVEELDRFLSRPQHELNHAVLDARLYKHILTHNDALHLDRKVYVGPISNSKDEQTIIQFYKSIDPTIEYCSSREGQEKYVLIEFNNRQSIARIFEKQTMPVSNGENLFALFKPLHPRQFVNRIISMKNKQNQIWMQGITRQITDRTLIEYFHKRAPVVACMILPSHSKCAIIEFNDKKTARKMLSTTPVSVQGINLSLNPASRSLASLLDTNNPNIQSEDDDDDDDEQNDEEIVSKATPTKSVVSSAQESIPLPSAQFVRVTACVSVTDPIEIPPSPEHNQSGWSSPPRTVITPSLSIDQPAVRASSRPCATSDRASIDASYPPPTTMDADIKPVIKSPTNNLMNFFEQMQTELGQIRDEYRSKFKRDQQHIEQEVRLLVNEERQTFEKLNQYLFDRRRQTEKRSAQKKRKSSPSFTSK